MMYVTTEAAVYAAAEQTDVTTARSSLLKKLAFARGLVLVPVVVGILDILLHFEKFQLSRQRHTILRLTKPDFQCIFIWQILLCGYAALFERHIRFPVNNHNRTASLFQAQKSKSYPYLIGFLSPPLTFSLPKM